MPNEKRIFKFTYMKNKLDNFKALEQLYYSYKGHINGKCWFLTRNSEHYCSNFQVKHIFGRYLLFLIRNQYFLIKCHLYNEWHTLFFTNEFENPFLIRHDHSSLVKYKKSL